MNKEYRKWLEAVRDDYLADYFHATFWGWVRTGQFKSMYREGLSPSDAAFELIPW